MSKTLTILLLLLAAFWTPKVYAQTINYCPSATITTPTTLFSNTKDATFAVDISQFGKTSDYKSWQMEFECGIQNKDTATIVDDTKISRRIDNHGCEFSPGNHTIKVIAGDTPQCRAQYIVIDAVTQCNLELHDITGKLLTPEDKIITSDSQLTVSGNNLASSNGVTGWWLVLFIDNERVEGSVNINTTSFSGIKIPNKFLTPTAHQLSLRTSSLFSDYGSPLCPLTFTVGTKTNPGSVVQANTGAGASANMSQPVVAGGKEAPGCTDNPKNPGIATAIGCIHTSPAEFVKDFMTFIIGISGGLAFLMMLAGAFQILSSADNPDTLKAGRERLTNAVMGLLIVIFAILLLQIIGVGILHLPGF